MMHGIDSIASMNRELKARTEAAGIQFECGAGGNFASEIAFIAEAPGEREVQQKLPLCGNSGKALWDILRKQSFTRNSTYVTNVSKRRILHTEVPTSNKAKFVIPKQELDHWNRLLLEELSLLPNLKYVVALGGYALKALTNEDGITNWRGSVMPVKIGERTVQLLATFNPAVILYEPKTELTFRMDLGKLPRIINGTFNPPVINALINPTYNEAMDYVDALKGTTTPISYDIETMSNETACIGFAASNTEGMCINFRTANANTFTLSQEANVRRNIQALFNHPGLRFVGQNTNFDNYWLYYKDRIRVPQTYFDTMLAHHTLYPTLPHNLGFLTAQYTDHPYYKDDGKFWREGVGDINTFWRYNVTDCCITRIVHEKEHEELVQQGMEAFFFNHVMKLQPKLTQMTIGGVKCDVDVKERITDELSRTVEQARNLCQTTAQLATGNPDYTFNPRSLPNLRTLFFTDLKLVGRGIGVDKENRDRMRKHPRTSEAARGTISAIDNYITEAKFLSTYASAEIDVDGRFRCEYKQTGVQSAPGRLSSAGVMWGTGLNLQNIPERAKAMFICDEGYELSYFDAAQIEARFVAWLANIKVWKEQFERARLNPGSYDAHRALAADMFKVPYEQVPVKDFAVGDDGVSRPTIRYIAKRCRHGLNYRMGADRLATTTGLSIGDATAAYEVYHRTTPEIRQWWDATVAEVRANRRLDSPLGRRWLLLERFDDAALESIIAFRPQSTAGDHITSVIYKCEDDPRWPKDARMMLNIHDALIAINRPCDGELVRALMRSYAEEPIIINGEECIVPAEFAVSQPDEFGIHRWSTLEKLKVAPELLSIQR